MMTRMKSDVRVEGDFSEGTFELNETQRIVFKADKNTFGAFEINITCFGFENGFENLVEACFKLKEIIEQSNKPKAI